MKIVILDFDGTVADTRRSIIKTVQLTLEHLELSPANDSEIKHVIGLPLRDTFVKAAHIQDEELITRAIEVYREKYFSVCMNTVQLFPKVKETLQYLYENNYIIAIASSKGKEALSMLLNKLNILPYITTVVGEQDVIHKKPAPDMVKRILASVSISPQDALVVGDTIYDIEMGKSAFCHTCGVTYGNHSATQLRMANADFIINDFSDIITIIHEK